MLGKMLSCLFAVLMLPDGPSNVVEIVVFYVF